MLSSLHFPNEFRLREALSLKLGQLIADRRISRGELAYLAERPAKPVELPGYNLFDAHRTYEVTPLFWLTPELPAKDFVAAWTALADLAVQRPGPNDNALMCESLRKSTFHVVRARQWLMGHRTEHRQAKLVPVLQALIMAVSCVADEPVLLGREEARAKIDGKDYWLFESKLSLPKIWGPPAAVPHHRTADFRLPADYQVEPLRVFSHAAAAFEKFGITDPTLWGLLRSIPDLDLSIDQVVDEELTGQRKLRAMKRFVREKSPTRFERVALDLEREEAKVAATQPLPDPATAFIRGTRLNMAGLYRMLVLEGGHLRHSEFTTRFGSPLRRDGSPRVVTVTSSPLYERYRERFLHVIDSAVTPL